MKITDVHPPTASCPALLTGDIYAAAAVVPRAHWYQSQHLRLPSLPTPLTHVLQMATTLVSSSEQSANAALFSTV